MLRSWNYKHSQLLSDIVIPRGVRTSLIISDSKAYPTGFK